MPNQNEFSLKLSVQGLANPANVVHFGHFRFTILASRLIRIEFDERDVFTDQISQTIWHRDTPAVPFVQTTGLTGLALDTGDLVLRCTEGTVLSADSLHIQIKSLPAQWQYGQKINTLKGTARTLDGVDGKTPLGEGVVSREGFALLDDSQSLLLDEDGWPLQKASSRTDLYFFGHGHDYAAAVRDYDLISGRVPMVPRYVLGNWWSKYWAYTDIELLDIVDHFKTEGIPLSICIVDMDWHLTAIEGLQDYWGGWTGYTVNKKYYPDLPGFIQKLHERGVRTSVNLHPANGVKSYEEKYGEMAKWMGIDPATQATIPFDCTSPRSMRGYFDILLHPFEADGVDFWWVDWQQGQKSASVGLDPLWMLNHLHYYDAARNAKRRPFTFSRWTSHGGQRYPIGFSGDAIITWDSLRYQPYFTATAANIGFGMWSHDIGGHYGGCDEPELFARWIQFGVFSPIMRIHSTCNRFIIREPWRQNPGVRTVVRDFLILRHRLIPYLYTAVHRDHAEGTPLITPLYYREPEEDLAYQTENGYYFGSELMVLPVTDKIDPATNRVAMNVYFPKGTWTDFFTDEPFAGSQVAKLDFELSHQAVFAKAGAIIPLSDSPDLKADANPDRLEIRVYPGADNAYALYEDDGLSNAYLDQDAFCTRFTLSETREGIVLTIDPDSTPKSYLPAKRTYVVDFVNVAASVFGQKALQAANHLKITLPECDPTVPQRIVLTSVVRIPGRAATQKALETFLVDNPLNPDFRRTVFEALSEGKDARSIRKVYAKAPKAIQTVLDRFLARLHPDFES